MIEIDDGTNHDRYSEHTFRSLLEQSDDGIVILTVEGKPLYTSPSVVRILGYSEEELMELDLVTLTHPDDLLQLAGIMEEVMANPGIAVNGHTGRMKHKDGSWRWLEATITNFLNDPSIAGIVDNFRDVTGKKATEEKLLHANRLYAFISQVNQTIVHSTNKQELYKKACRIAIEFGKFKAAWIGVFDIPAKKVKLVEESGMLPEDLQYFTSVDYSENGPQAHVLKTGKEYICNNIGEHSELGSWKAFALKRGYASYIALPIQKAGNVIGTFNIVSTEIDYFDEVEIALLTEATGDISFALDVFEKEKHRKQMADKVIRSELQLNQAQAIAHIGSWDLVFSSGIATWSDEACKIYGFDPTDNYHTYDEWIAFIHPEDLAYVLEASKKGQETLSSTAFHHRIVLKDGTVKHIYSQSEIEFDKEGNPTGMHGVAHDVTEMKNAEEDLNKSYSELENALNIQSSVLNALPAHIALIDTEGIILTVNEAWKAFGVSNGLRSKNQAIGDNYLHIAENANGKEAEDGKVAAKGIRDVMEGNLREFHFEYTCDSPREERWFRMIVTPLNVNKLGAVIMHLDISDQRRAKDQLERSEANLQAVIENTDASIYSLDRNLCYITFNKSLRNNLKDVYGLEIKTGDSVYKFLERIEPGDAAEWKATYTKALAGETVKFEREFSYPGFYSCISFSIYPILENDVVVGLSCFAIDVTKQKQDAIQKEKLLADIIHRNKNLEQFSYIVSHNLRAPVANILGLTDLLETSNYSEDERTIIEGISTSVKKLDMVINDLNFVLQVNHKVNENKEKVQLSLLLSDIRSSISTLLNTEEVEIIADFSSVDEIPTLKSYLHSIFFNLISNSIKYAQPGIRPVIYITSYKGANSIQITFKDNGLGIDLEKNANNLFGLYKRFHSHTEGKGMGLYMVRKQVEALGGKITIDSAVNKGTTFTITFENS